MYYVSLTRYSDAHKKMKDRKAEKTQNVPCRRLQFCNIESPMIELSQKNSLWSIFTQKYNKLKCILFPIKACNKAIFFLDQKHTRRSYIKETNCNQAVHVTIKACRKRKNK